MKKLTSLFIAIIAISMFSCSDPNEMYLDKIKQKVKEDALGIDMNYKNLDFIWVDTFFVKEEIKELTKKYDEKLTTIMKIKYYDTEFLFSKKYVTKKKYLELRNQENKFRKGSFNGDYCKYACENTDKSPWLLELCNQIKTTDSLINVYDEIKEGDLCFIKNVNWFYHRTDHFYSNKKGVELWNAVKEVTNELTHIKYEIDSLSKLDSNYVIHYKAFNKFKINNPILNNAEQELESHFYFDNKMNIIKRD